MKQFKPFKVIELFGEGYIIAQDNIIAGMPTIYETKEQALKVAKELNELHGLKQPETEK